MELRHRARGHLRADRTREDVAFDGRDLDDVAVVGSTYGEIDIEALAAADPDLIVTTVYPEDSSGEIPDGAVAYGFMDATQQEQVAEIAPIIQIAYTGSAADVIERVVELAEALGVDTGSGEVAAARADFEAASEALREAAGNGVTVLPVFATQGDGWYMAKAPTTRSCGSTRTWAWSSSTRAVRSTSGTPSAGRACRSTAAT